MCDSPRAYWRLGETSGTTAVDQIGGAPGNHRNGVTLGVVGALAGDFNRAVRFDGTNDVIGMSDPTSGVLDFGTGDFAVEAWVKATADNERAIISKRVFFSSEPYWEVTATDDGGHKGEVRATVNNGTVTRQAYGPAIRVDKDGLWHHVAVNFDRDFGITVYVDGVSRTTTGSFTGNISNTAELLVGKSTSLFILYFKGDLDDVALYGGLLLAARIQAHRSAGLQRGGTPGSPTSPLLASGLFALTGDGAGAASAPSLVSCVCEPPAGQSPAPAATRCVDPCVLGAE